MTNREREILSWLRRDPLIPQQALADRLGITRSSVGVHISNLMQKGYILGKGYILANEGRVAVVGAPTLISTVFPAMRSSPASPIRGGWKPPAAVSGATLRRTWLDWAVRYPW